MPKSITATKVEVRGLSFQVDDAGVVTGLSATLGVDYGAARNSESFDLWAELTATQRTVFQTIYNKLVSRITASYIT